MYLSFIFEAVTKSWKEKFFGPKAFEIKTTKNSFWGHPPSAKMLIPSPKIIQEYIYPIAHGTVKDVQRMRKDLASKYGADFTCPLTTGIFLKIVAEYNHEQMIQNPGEPICPFWRVIDPNGKLSEKLSFPKDFIRQKREEEQQHLTNNQNK